MSGSRPRVTGTSHTLPFERLSPREFERLCLWLVKREGYERAEHLGAAGSEQGRDIVAWREGELWAFQCKRVEEFGPSDAEAEVDKVLGLPEDLRPVALVFLVACDVSDETRRRARARCGEEVACEFWGLTELDGRVKRYPEIVAEFFEPVRDEGAGPGWWRRFRRRPAVFYPTLAFGIVAAIVGLVAGLVWMGADLGGAREQLQGWGLVRAFPREGRDETLIVIASFHHAEGVPDTEAHWEICRAIRGAKDDLGYSNLRVEVEPTRLRAEDRDGAEKLGRRYNASMIIWGSDAGVRVVVNYLNVKDPEFEAAEVEISETQATYVVNAGAHAEFVTRDLPGQLTFLSLFAVGQSYYTEGAYAESLDAIVKGITSLPSETEALEGLADAYFRLGWLHQVRVDEHGRAIVYYGRAIELNPEGAWALNNRGVAYVRSGDYARAMVDFDRAIELNPEDATAFNNRGLAYCEREDYARAMVDFDRAVELNPEDGTAFNNRGLAYCMQEDYVRAMVDFDRAMRLNREDATAFNNRGLAYYKQGEYGRALEDFDRAIELNPEAATAFNNRGAVYADSGDDAAAIADYKRAIELDPEYVTALYNRGLAYSRQKEPILANASYDRAIELDPEHALALYNRALAYFRSVKYAQAIAYFDRFIELNPEHAEAFYYRGLAYRHLGDRAQAIADLDRAIELNPQYAEAVYRRGVIYSLSWDFEAALAEYTKAIEIDPYFAKAYSARAASYRWLGNAEAALADYRRYLELRPDAIYREVIEGWIAQLERQVSEP